MHSFNHHGTAFNFNSDLSGDVRIATVGMVGDRDTQVVSQIWIPGEALIAFMADRVRASRISRFEDDLYAQQDEQILGLK